MRVNCVEPSFDLLTSRANLSVTMECPRCGFSQPDDRFCANCGLNVASYLARPKPLTKKILSHPLTYLVAAIAIGYGLVTWVKMNPNSGAPKGIAVESAAPVAVTKSASESTSARRELLPEQVQTKNLALNAEAEKSAVDTSAVATAGATTASQIPSAKDEIKPINQINIQFFEVAHEAFLNLSNEAKAVDHNGWKTLVVSSEKLTPLLNQGRRLPGGKNMNASPSSGSQLQFSLGAGEVPLGLFFDLSVVKNEAGHVDLEFSGQIDLKHDATSETHSKSEFSQSLNSTQALIVSGWLPKKSLSETYPNLNQTPLMAIQSPDYIEGQSDAILVIDLK